MTTKPSFTTLAVALSLGLLAGGRAAWAQEPPAVPADPNLAPPGAPPAAETPTPPPAETPTPTPPPAETPPPPPPPPAPVVAPPPPPPAPVEEPLAGVSNQTMFLRSPDNMFIFFPNGRLQTDGYFYKTSNSGEPRNSFLIKRARLELAGWIAQIAYFQIGADFASGAPTLATNPGANGASTTTNAPANQTNINATDDFVAVAPWEEDYAILQFGQFDAPFTLENRTSDKYFDFIERSFTVRAFGIPTNKEQGLMLHGTNPDRNYYYSAAVINGDGQNYKNVDDNFDIMGRAWIAPLSFVGIPELHDITLGGSYWTGNRSYGLPLANQQTAGGYTILNTSMPKTAGGDQQGINQQGRHHTWALEVNAPIMHKFGARWEYVHKDQPLSAIDTTTSTTSVENITAGMHLKGWSTYIEAWGWVMGDDRIIGEPGMQMPTRFKKFGVKPPVHGLMLLGRVEVMHENLTADDPAGTVATAKSLPGGLGQTELTAYTLGFNYWISRRFRTSFNWTLNHITGDTSNVKGLKEPNEQEFSFRLAIAL
jgi:hypothetical protein